MKKPRLAFLPLILLVVAAGACRGPEYGGKPVTVVLTTREQAHSPADGDAPGAAVAYLIALDDWIELKGRDRFAEIERLRLEGADADAAAACKRLLVDVARFKTSTPTPVEARVYPRVHVFLAERSGAVRFQEFDPVRMDPAKRVVEVSFRSPG
jgi:hypothetical protein